MDAGTALAAAVLGPFFLVGVIWCILWLVAWWQTRRRRVPDARLLCGGCRHLAHREMCAEPTRQSICGCIAVATRDPRDDPCGLCFHGICSKHPPDPRGQRRLSGHASRPPSDRPTRPFGG